MRELQSPGATQAAGAELGRALIADPDRRPGSSVSRASWVPARRRSSRDRCALGHGGAVRSPTYTFIEPYRLADRAIHHCDLYRITSADEIDDLGLRELVADDALLLVEWPRGPRAGSACSIW